MITLGRNACCRNSTTQQGLHLTLLACTMDWRGCDTDFYTNFTSSEAEIGRGGTERLRGLKSAPEERPVTAVTGTRQWNCNPWDVKLLSERGKSTVQPAGGFDGISCTHSKASWPFFRLCSQDRKFNPRGSKSANSTQKVARALRPLGRLTAFATRTESPNHKAASWKFQ